MAGSIKDLHMRLRSSGFEKGQKDMKGLGAASDSTKGKLKSLAISAGAVVAALVGIDKASDYAVKVADLGDQYKDLELQFKNLTEASGKDYIQFLNQLESATDNAISKSDLYQQANKALLLDLEKAGFAYVDVARDVKDFADATGRDATQALQSFTQAVASGELETFKTFGIDIGLLNSETEKYIATLGKQEKDLTTSEKLTAKQAGAVSALSIAVEQLVETEQNAGDAAQKVLAQQKNLNDAYNAGVAESDYLRGANEKLADAYSEVTPEVRVLGEELGGLLGVLVRLKAGYVILFDDIATALGLIQEMSEETKALDRSTADLVGTIEDQASATEVQIQLRQQERSILTEQEALLKAIDKLESDPQQKFVGNNAKAVKSISEKNERLDELQQQLLVVRQSLSSASYVATEFSDKLGGEGSADVKDFSAEIDKLTQKLDDLNRAGQLSDLQSNLKDALLVGDSSAISDLTDKIEQSIQEGILAGMGEAASSPDAQQKALAIAELQTDLMVKGIKTDVDKALHETFEKQVDFFTDIFSDAMNGEFELDNLEDAAKRWAAGLLGGTAANLASSAGLNIPDVSNATELGQEVASQLFKGQGFSIFGDKKSPVLTDGSGITLGAAEADLLSILGLDASSIGANPFVGGDGGFLSSGIGSTIMAAGPAAAIGAAGPVTLEGIKQLLNGDVGMEAGAVIGTTSGMAAGKIVGMQGSSIAGAGAGSLSGVSTANLLGPVGAVVGAVFSDELDAIFSKHFGSGKSEAQRERDALRGGLKELFGGYDIDLLAGGSSSIIRGFDGSHRLPDDAVTQSVTPLTGALQSALGITTEFGENATFVQDLMAQIVVDYDKATGAAYGYNDAVINTLGIFDELDIQLEGTKESIKELWLQGELGLGQFGEQLQAVNDLQNVNLEGVGNIDAALAGLAGSYDEPAKQLKYLEALQNEFEELGVHGIDNIAIALGERLGPEYEQVFKQISGVTGSLRDLDEGPVDMLYSIAASLETVRKGFQDTFQGDLSRAGDITNEVGREIVTSFRNANDEVRDLRREIRGLQSDLSNINTSKINGLRDANLARGVTL